MAERSSCFYEFGPFRMDPIRRRLLRGQEVVPLASKVFDTLLALVEHGGRELSKDELMKHVWPDSFVEEGNLTINIFTLRKALGEKPDDHQYIVTIPGRGYRFVTSVKRVPAEVKERREEEPETTIEETPLRSFAVLPFKSLGSNGDDEYLGIGLADALITRLSSIHQIVVRPTSAVGKYAAREQDPVIAGREMGVQSVLDGSIRRSGERMRVTVQLVRVRDGRPLWADKFDGNFTDIFSLEDSISEQVTQALTLKLTGEEESKLTKRYTANSEAHEAYLKARYYSIKWTMAVKNEIQWFNQAIKLDPCFALAYAGLADTYYRASTVFLPPHEAMPKAKEAAIRALELDNTLAEAHASLGVAREYCDWDWAEAEKEFRRSIELNPNYATGRLWYGLYLLEMGRLEESVSELQHAQQLDPLSAEINTFLALPHFCARKYERAIEQLKRTTEIEPVYLQAYYFLGWVYEQQGDLAEALEHYRKTKELVPNLPLVIAAMGHAYGVCGRAEEAQAALAELIRLSNQIYVSPYDVALIHLGLGEKDRAFELFEEAYEERSVWMVRLNVDLRLAPLRSDPRFTDLQRRIASHGKPL